MVTLSGPFLHKHKDLHAIDNVYTALKVLVYNLQIPGCHVQP